MSVSLRAFGKKFALPSATGGWSFSLRPGGWVIAEAPDGSRRRFAMTEFRGRLSFSLGGRSLSGEITEDREQGAAAGGGDSELVAQFPGRVRKILVREGASVAEGDPLILVEAMKMEFTVKAPFAGKVSRVLVTEGQQLSPGDRFVACDPPQAAETKEPRGG